MIPIGDENPTRSFPVVNTIFLVVNIAVFVYGFFHPVLYEAWIRSYAFVAVDFWSSPIESAYRLASHMFLHGGWLHLAGNMLFLYIFGDNIEDRLGHVRYFVFYMVAGFCGALAQGWFMQGSGIPMIGASAAISGVVIAYMFFFPTKNIVTLLFLIPVKIPAVFYILVWAGMQVFNSLIFSAIFTSQGGWPILLIWGEWWRVFSGFWLVLRNSLRRAQPGKDEFVVVP